MTRNTRIYIGVFVINNIENGLSHHLLLNETEIRDWADNKKCI